MATPVQAWVIAPLWKRGLATLLDSLPFFVMALALTFRTPSDRPRRQRHGSGLAGLVFSGAYHVSLMVTRGQTPGMMVVGIKVVDAKTGAVPSLKQSAVRWAAAMVPSEGLSRLVPSSDRAESTLAAMTDLEPEIYRLTQRHQGDRRKFNEELMGLFEEANVNPNQACLPILLRALPGLVFACALNAPSLQPPLHQALHERIAGTVVVQVDRKTSR